MDSQAAQHVVTLNTVAPPLSGFVFDDGVEVVIAIVASLILFPVYLLLLALDQLFWAYLKTLPFLNFANSIRIYRIHHHSVFLSGVADSFMVYDLLDQAIFCGGDQHIFFAKRLQNDGTINFVHSRGIFVGKHTEVANMLLSAQNRSNLIDTWRMEVGLVMNSYSPILLSNSNEAGKAPSDTHALIRRLIVNGTVDEKNAKERIQNATKILAPILKEWISSDPANWKNLSRTVFKCLCMLLFGEELDESVLKSIDLYQQVVPGVLLPRFFHAATFYSVARTLKKHRSKVSQSLPIRNNAQFISSAAEIGVSIDDACDTVTDLLLFAGVLGTSTLVNAVIKRISENKIDRIPLYLCNPLNFIYESSRLKPPVLVFSTLSSEPLQLLVRGKLIEIPVGTPVAGCISTANSDPDVWGEDSEEFKIARDYSKLLTWNGLFDVGPRACPGFDLARAIVLEMTRAYVGSADYKLVIYTGWKSEAASSADFMVKITGTKGSTKELPLPNEDAHNRGEVEFYTIGGEFDVGEITSIELWRKDEIVLDFSPNWYVDRIEVEKLGAERNFYFPCYGWIPNKPIPIFEGVASTITSATEDSAQSRIRSDFLKSKRLEYQYVTNHKELGEWGETLPTTVKLTREGELPLPERPLKEESSDFDTLVREALINAGVKIISEDKPKTLQEYIEKTRLPNLFNDKSAIRLPPRQGWQRDESFAWLMIAGMNPVQLKNIDNIPSEFHVTDDMLPGGRKLETELKNRCLFMLDDDFLLPMVGKHTIRNQSRYLYVPYALFHADAAAGLKLIPIAIQIQRTPGSPVFTPKDSEWDWFAAKMFVLNCHFQSHQFRAHALWCHLLQEPVLVGLNRSLPPCHPIYKLLHPHFYGLANINSKARGTLIAAKKGISLFAKQGDVTSVGADGNIKVAQLAYKNLSFEETFFRNRLSATGILENKAIGDHPFRDDGLLMLESIEKYVTKIVDIYYLTDDSVKQDVELQSWAADLVNEGKIKGFPGNGTIGTKSMLVYISTNIIFTASAFHSSVNFSQIVYAGTVANMPGALFGPPPTRKGQLSEKDILEMLPPINVALTQVAVLTILSTNSGDKLGYLNEVLFVESEALKAQEEWRQDLARIQKVMEERNKLRPEEYRGFLPSDCPNSTAI